MLMKKENKRSLVLIGKQQYDFDIELEVMIYRYLCYERIKKIEFKKMESKYKFKSYKQWKQYIHDKYIKYSNEELEEFSRYLNLKIRRLNPQKQYRNLTFPILCTIAFSKMVDFFVKNHVEFSKNIIAFLIFLLLTLFLGVEILIMLAPSVKFIFDDDIEENMLKDYKEIIDGMITYQR